MLAGVAALGGLDTSLRRWGKFSEELSSETRACLVAQVCIRMLPDAGAGARSRHVSDCVPLLHGGGWRRDFGHLALRP